MEHISPTLVDTFSSHSQLLVNRLVSDGDILVVVPQTFLLGHCHWGCQNFEFLWKIFWMKIFPYTFNFSIGFSSFNNFPPFYIMVLCWFNFSITVILDVVACSSNKFLQISNPWPNSLKPWQKLKTICVTGVWLSNMNGSAVCRTNCSNMSQCKHQHKRKWLLDNKHVSQKIHFYQQQALVMQ